MLKRILARLYQPLTDLRDQQQHQHELLSQVLTSVREIERSAYERSINFRRQLMSIHDDIQAMIQQARTNHDVEMSATQAIHSLLDRLGEQVSSGDLEAVRETMALLRSSAGSLGQAIAETEAQPTGGAAEPMGEPTAEPLSPPAPGEEPDQPS